MASSKRLLSGSAFLAVVGGILLGACLSASAYTACNSNGDCWHTDERVNFPGVQLTFHDDNWRDQHKSDAQYHWHEADADHDWHHGYWTNGEWHHD